MSSFTEAYREAFRSHVLQLIAWGYHDSTPALDPSLQEEEITGLIVAAIDARLRGFDIPLAYEHYVVHEEKPHASGGRTGKRRRRLDITLTRTGRGAQPHYTIEAKRLNDGRSLDKYLGVDGLGCFVNEAYAADQPEAAMLGYVQTPTCELWGIQLEKEFLARTPPLRVVEALQRLPLHPDLSPTWRSSHQRPSSGVIRILHVFLDCCSTS